MAVATGRRVLAVLVACALLPLLPPGTTSVATAASPVPTPAALGTWPSRDGLGVSWARLPLIDGTAPGYIVERSTDRDVWEVVDLPSLESSAEHHLVDPDVAPGVTASYRVSAILDERRSGPSEPVTGTRAAEVPEAGDIAAVTIDVTAPGPHPRVADPLERSHHAMADASIRLHTAFGTEWVTVPRVTAPGAYATGDDPSEGWLLVAEPWRCGAVTGTFLVEEVLYDRKGRLEVLTANYDGRCERGGTPVSGSIRFGSSVPYRGATVVSPDLVDARTTLGSALDSAVEVRNTGRFPVEVSDARILPLHDHVTGAVAPGHEDWTVLDDDCADRTLGPGERCAVTVRFRPTAGSARAAALELTDPADGSARSLELVGHGIVPPDAPTHGRALAHVGRVSLSWQIAGEGDGTVDAFVVSRRVAGTSTWSGSTVIEREGGESLLHWADTAAVPGTAYEYRIRARNEAGLGASLIQTATSLRRDLVAISYGRDLHAIDLGTRGAVAVLDEAPSAGPTATPDGRHTIHARSGDAGFDLVRQPSWGGAAVRLTTLPGDELDPAVSPDGRLVAFTRVVDGRSSVWVVPTTGGRPVRRADRAAHPSWLPDSRSLVATDLSSADGPALARVDEAGRRRPIAGGASLHRPAVSPDGSTIAAVTASVPGQLALLDLAATEHVNIGAPESADVDHVRWSPDGRELSVAITERAGGGRTTQRLASYQVRHRPLRATGRVVEGTVGLSQPTYRSLGVHLTQAPHLTSSSARVGFAVAHAPAGTTMTCRLDGGSARACTTPWVATDLAGGTHTLVVEATEPSGARSVTAHRFVTDVTPPTVRTTGPTAALTLGDRATVTYTASDANGVGGYDVRYRVARSNAPFQAWVYPDSWQRTTATSRSVALARGSEVCFAVRARDAVGNRSAWSAPRCTSRPLDDRALGASAGWTRTESRAAFDGTLTRTSRRGETLARGTVRARQVILLATRCPDCGKVEVLIDGVRIGTADLAAPSTRHQVAIALPRRSTVIEGRLTIRTTTGSPVRIDGVAFRQS